MAQPIVLKIFLATLPPALTRTELGSKRIFHIQPGALHFNGIHPERRAIIGSTFVARRAGM